MFQKRFKWNVFDTVQFKLYVFDTDQFKWNVFDTVQFKWNVFDTVQFKGTATVPNRISWDFGDCHETRCEVILKVQG